jgi:hypothetical protein
MDEKTEELIIDELRNFKKQAKSCAERGEQCSNCCLNFVKTLEEIIRASDR